MVPAILFLAPSLAWAGPTTCLGDCNGSRDVTVDEVVIMVNIALGNAQVSSCRAGDADGGGAITVDEVIGAVRTALDGCKAAPTTPTAQTSGTPTAVETTTPAETPTPPTTVTGSPESTETETLEETETETPEPTTTNGMMARTATPHGTGTVAVTPSQAPSRTNTPAGAPTNTQVVIPTATVFVPPTSTLPPAPTSTVATAGVAVNVGSAAGPAGSTVAITVSLAGGGGAVTATGTDILYDSRLLQVARNGNAPACAIHPNVGPGSAADKSLLLSVASQSNVTERVRIGVISFQNQNSIPDGPLFTCQFRIAGNASGVIAIENMPSASSANGDSIPAGGTNGAVTVQ